MKRLTLDQTWEKCLAMWKWISRRCKGHTKDWCRDNIRRLKKQWIEDNGFNDDVTEYCFLCNRTSRSGSWEWDCKKCPACKIDPKFDCTHDDYDFRAYPRRFYAELKRLNKIRLEKKAK